MLGPISALQNIDSVIKLIYAQAPLVKVNPQQCQRLAEHIGIIEQGVRNLDQTKEQYQKRVNDLLMGLQCCLQCMNEVGSLKAFFKAGHSRR